MHARSGAIKRIDNTFIVLEEYMVIKYRTDPKGKFKKKTVNPGITVAEFIDIVKDNIQYDIYAARIN